MQRICPPGASIMAVGDARQAIYAFRGATMYNLLSFADHFPATPAERAPAGPRQSPSPPPARGRRPGSLGRGGAAAAVDQLPVGAAHPRPGQLGDRPDPRGAARRDLPGGQAGRGRGRGAGGPALGPVRRGRVRRRPGRAGPRDRPARRQLAGVARRRRPRPVQAAPRPPAGGARAAGRPRRGRRPVRPAGDPRDRRPRLHPARGRRPGRQRRPGPAPPRPPLADRPPPSRAAGPLGLAPQLGPQGRAARRGPRPGRRASPWPRRSTTWTRSRASTRRRATGSTRSARSCGSCARPPAGPCSTWSRPSWSAPACGPSSRRPGTAGPPPPARTSPPSSTGWPPSPRPGRPVPGRVPRLPGRGRGRLRAGRGGAAGPGRLGQADDRAHGQGPGVPHGRGGRPVGRHRQGRVPRYGIFPDARVADPRRAQGFPYELREDAGHLPRFAGNAAFRASWSAGPRGRAAAVLRRHHPGQAAAGADLGLVVPGLGEDAEGPWAVLERAAGHPAVDVLIQAEQPAASPLTERLRNGSAGPIRAAGRRTRTTRCSPRASPPRWSWSAPCRGRWSPGSRPARPTPSGPPPKPGVTCSTRPGSTRRRPGSSRPGSSPSARCSTMPAARGTSTGRWSGRCRRRPSPPPGSARWSTACWSSVPAASPT